MVFFSQGHLLEHHPCAHLYACQFCGIAFLSLEALKSHDGCEGFAAGIVQRITSSGDIEVGILCLRSSLSGVFK